MCEQNTVREESTKVYDGLVYCRDEVLVNISNARSSGIEKELIGRYKQAYTTFIFWYAQWDKNRDYSSAINVSMALGKLSAAVDAFALTAYAKDSPAAIQAIDATNKLAGRAWEEIRAATGRIVPFE